MANVQPLTDGDPRRLGDYDVTGRLGEGGQGIVYLGRGPTGQVAVKLLHAQLIEDEQARARFVREVAVTKRVARFCTAQVLSAGVAEGRPYIVSEYVPGPSLFRQLREDGPRRGSALDRLAVNTATALAAIHQAGVVHLDFKPGNVLMGPDGPVVIDFGISRALDASGTMTSAVSQVVGTPAFMAPEQLSEGMIGPHTDMFAWAVTMVYAASGVPAFGHRSIPQVINRILHEEPDLGALDGRLRTAVAACLSKDPTKRPTARSLMDELMGHDMPAFPSTNGTLGNGTPAHGTPGTGPAGAGLAGSGAGGGGAVGNGAVGNGASGSSGAVGGGAAGSSAAGSGTPGGLGSTPGNFGSATEGAEDPRTAGFAGPSYSTENGPSSTGGVPASRPGDPEARTTSLPATSPSTHAGHVGHAGHAGHVGHANHESHAGHAGHGGHGGTGTAYLPSAGSPTFADHPDPYASADHRTMHLPASGPPPAGVVPGSPAHPGPAGPPGPREPRKGRTALIVGAIAAVAIALIAGIAALASSKGDSGSDQAAAPPPPSKQARHPSRHRTPTASHTPSRRPAAVKSVKARANPYTPQRLCGAGYRVIDSHALGDARAYLLYNAHAGANCVVTMVPRSTGKVFLNASLMVQGGGHRSRTGAFPFYAGPVRLPAKGKCVMWGGATKTAKWASGWSHCGK